MLKVLSPKEVILNNASKNVIVSDFVNEINSLLEKSTPSSTYEFSLLTKDGMSNSDKGLILEVFKIFGWNAYLTSNKNDDGIVYTIWLNAIK